MNFGFGVDLGGTTVKLACFDETGQLQDKWEIPTRIENSGENILPDIAGTLQAYCQARNIGNVIGVGIGVPGAVMESGVVKACDNLGWGTVDVAKTLGELTGFRVVAGNDAAVAALGECRMGSGKGRRNMVMVTLGTGVGGGIVVEGKILGGTHGAGGEIGHMVLNRAETQPCNCGKRGCAEQYCSATGIVRLAKKALAETERESALRGQDFACKDVFDFASRGDALCQEVLEQVYGYLGELIANICCVADPEIVVLGGGVSRAGEPLLTGIKRYFLRYAYHPCANTEFALAALGNDAGIYGAFQMLLDD